MSKHRHYRVLLVKSGRTAWDCEGRLAGGADLPLSETGMTELDATLDGLRRLPDSLSGVRVLTSADEASLRTAEAIAETFDGSSKTIEELHDVSLGLWEGSLRSELDGRCPTAYRKWVDEPWSVTPPEGEPLDQAIKRLRSRMIRALEKQKSGVATVCFVLRPSAWNLMAAWLGEAAMAGETDSSESSNADDAAADAHIALFNVEVTALKSLEPKVVASAS